MPSGSVPCRSLHVEHNPRYSWYSPRLATRPPSIQARRAACGAVTSTCPRHRTHAAGGTGAYSPQLPVSLEPLRCVVSRSAKSRQRRRVPSCAEGRCRRANMALEHKSLHVLRNRSDSTAASPGLAPPCHPGWAAPSGRPCLAAGLEEECLTSEITDMQPTPWGASCVVHAPSHPECFTIRGDACHPTGTRSPASLAGQRALNAW